MYSCDPHTKHPWFGVPSPLPLGDGLDSPACSITFSHAVLQISLAGFAWDFSKAFYPVALD